MSVYINPPVHSLSQRSTQNLGARRNIRAILGDQPLLWCWPAVTPGTGLKYQLLEGDGKWVELSAVKGGYMHGSELEV